MGMMRMKMVTLVRIGRSVISTTHSEDRRACRLHRTEPCTISYWRIVVLTRLLRSSSRKKVRCSIWLRCCRHFQI